MPHTRVAINRTWLLWVYGCIPLLCMVVALDLLVFSGAIQKSLPANPYTVFLFALLFNVPHHVASLFSLADPEYVRRYRWQLLLGLPCVLFAYGLFAYVSPLVALAFFVLYTEYHVISQQLGIARLFMSVSLPVAMVWKFLALVLSTILYVRVMHRHINSDVVSFLTVHVFPIAVVIFSIVSVYILLKTDQISGKTMMLAMAASILSPFAFLTLGYPFFALVVGRVIHDITAFMFYMVHDYNRSIRTGANLWYRLFAPTHIPVLVLTPVLAVVLAYGIQHAPFISAPALAFLFISHYYVEGFVWKRGSPHREQLSFTGP